jgi:hypothetical protein
VPAPPGYLLFSYILREVQPEVKPEAQPEVKPEVQLEVKPEVQPEVKPSDKSVVHMAKEKKESLL